MFSWIRLAVDYDHLCDNKHKIILSSLYLPKVHYLAPLYYTIKSKVQIESETVENQCRFYLFLKQLHLIDYHDLLSLCVFVLVAHLNALHHSF